MLFSYVSCIIYWKINYYLYSIGLDFICVSNWIMFSTKRWGISACQICKPRKSGFTLREVLIVVVVVSIGLVSVIVALSNGSRYLQRTMQKVIAINLAREWMEAVYQIRDTNRTRWAWVKDSCRLKINPLVDDNWSVSDCSSDFWMTSGYYILQRSQTWGQSYFSLTGLGSTPFLSWVNLSDGIGSTDNKFTLCHQTWSYWDACPGTQSTTTEWRYFRQIQWLWLYRKDININWWSWLNCSSWNSQICWSSIAKEFRFCSKVAYVGDTTGEVQFCGVITNFMGQ